MPDPQLLARLNLGQPQQELTQENSLPIVAHHAIDGQTALQLESTEIHEEAAAEHPHDIEARKYGWLTLSSGEMYNGQIVKTADTDSQVFISIMNNGSWEAWRETWKKGALKSASDKIIAKGVPFKVALQKASQYAQVFKRNR